MRTGLMPFMLVPLLVYTYFWINPMALTIFVEGMAKAIVEIYLGFKAWKLEWETRRAFNQYKKASLILARQEGYPKKLVKAYFKTYGQNDWRFLWQQNKDAFEEKHRDLEDELREMILF